MFLKPHSCASDLMPCGYKVARTAAQEWDGGPEESLATSRRRAGRKASFLHDARHPSLTYPARMALDMHTTYISSHPTVPRSAPKSKIHIWHRLYIHMNVYHTHIPTLYIHMNV